MKKIIVGASMLVGLGACTAPAVQGPEVVGETAAAISGGGTYQIHATNLGNKCLDVNGNSQGNGGNVQLWTCNGSSAQNWVAIDKGGGYFALQHQGTNQCLNRDTSGNNSDGGGNVQQYDCQWSGSNEFQWSFDANTSHIWSRYDGKCLDVSGNNSGDGTNVQTWQYNTSGAQNWNPPGGGGGGGGGTAGIAGVIDQNTFNSWFPSRNGLYTWSGFVAMNNKYPDIANQSDMNLRKREVAAMLAHFAHETGDFVYTQEITPTCGCNTGIAPYSCPAGTCNYYGRGWTQLTWNFNYYNAGNALGYDLLNNPGWVSSDANVSAQTGAWYWATQYGPGGYGANSHQAISDSNGGGGFGATTAHINGSIECPSLGGTNTAARDDRFNRYNTYCSRLGCNGLGNNTGC